MATRTAELIAKLTDQVSGPAKGMAGALKGTTAAIDALKAKAGAIDAFRQMSKGLDDASQKMKVAQQNVRKIKAEMEAAGDGGKKLAGALRSAERQAESAKNAFRSQGQEVRAMRAALEQAGVPLNKLAAYERDLRAEVERTTAALKKQEQAASAAGGRRSGLTDPIRDNRLNHPSTHQGGGSGGGSAGGALAGGALARFGVAAAGIGGAAYVLGDQIRKAGQSSISFERSMIEVGKATDASGADLEAYGEKVLDLSRATGKTKEELATMLSSAGFAGRPKAELMDFTDYAAKATVAWQTSADDTGQALAEIGNIYEANQKRIEEIGDAINTMADNSASKETDLLDFMRRAGASAKEAGISAENMLAFGASMKEVGVRTDVAATGFEALLNVMKLGKEFSKKAGDGLKELGIDSTKMRKAFVAKPVETMVGLLEKIKNVADPLKRAEIMTNLFGKEYQDDIAKLLNALPKVTQYLALMNDKAKLAAGGVRNQFAQNLDKDVSKIDRATASLDVLYKRLGDPIKVAAGGVSEQINGWVEKLEQGDTVAQRLLKRLAGGGEDKPGGTKPETKDEGDPIGRATTSLIRTFDPKFGKTREEQAQMDRDAAAEAKRASAAKLFGAPGRIEEQIARRRAVLERSREVVRGQPGIQRDAAQVQAAKSESEIQRLQGDLARAWDAIGALRAQEQRDRGAFGVGGPSGKGDGDVGSGLRAFGFGVDGTTTIPSKRVPLPPVPPSRFRPAGARQSEPEAAPSASPPPAPGPDAAKIAEATAALEKYRAELATVTSELSAVQGLELPGMGEGIADRQAELRRSIAETEAKLKALTAEPVAPQASAAGLAPLGTAAVEATAQLTALNGITVAPQGNTGGIDKVTASAREAAAALRDVIALGGQAQVAIGKVNAASAGAAGTGNVAQRLQNTRTDTGM